MYGNMRRKYSDVAFIKYHKNAATKIGMKIERPIQSRNIVAPNIIKRFIVCPLAIKAGVIVSMCMQSLLYLL